MKYFFDTEFFDRGTTIDLISIAMVSEDNRELYFINTAIDIEELRQDQWLNDNVVSKFEYGDPNIWLTTDEIRSEIVEFVNCEKPEFWADYASYDWVVLCQLFGKMLDIPKHWPKFCMDIQNFKKIMCPELKFPDINTNKHHPLDDSKEVKFRHQYIMDHRQ
jgi:hypothetical protein